METRDRRKGEHVGVGSEGADSSTGGRSLGCAISLARGAHGVSDSSVGTPAIRPPLRKELGLSVWNNPQWAVVGPRAVRNLSEAKREGGFVSSKDTSKAKNYIPGRPKYACLEKLLAFMKSLVRKAGLQMTASERQ